MKYKMMPVRFQLLCLLAFAGVLITLLFAGPVTATAQSQVASTETPTAGSTSAYIAQTYNENGVRRPINVRTGPSTVDYPVIGELPIGATAAALGASPKREWIQIVFPGGPGGVGWVYAANVTLTGSVQVVEPPPTAIPPTIDSTLAATFEVEPTVTRSPTFTPPPPLAVPTFSPVPVGLHGLPTGAAIMGLSLGGVLVLAASLLGRR
jgi:hypothetical protein